MQGQHLPSVLAASLRAAIDELASSDFFSCSLQPCPCTALSFSLLPQAMADIYTWLRYSATRQLTWQRNYNTQPRILSAAQVGGVCEGGGGSQARHLVRCCCIKVTTGNPICLTSHLGRHTHTACTCCCRSG